MTTHHPPAVSPHPEIRAGVSPLRRTITEYALAVVMTLLALLTRSALDPALGDHFPYISFYIAVAVTAWFGGLGPSLTAMALGGLASQWYLVPPRESLAITEPMHQIGYLTYFGVCLVVVGIAQARRTAQLRAEAALVDLRHELFERKQAEANLRESDARFRALADAAPALIWINGPQGAEFVNRTYLEFLGANPRDIQAYEWAQFVHPDDRKRYLDGYLQAVDRRAVFDAEFRFRRHDGEWRWMRSVARPRMSEQGAFLGYAGVTIDITERKRTEEALIASERRFSMFMRNLPGLAWLKDAEGRYCYVNEAAQRVFGRPAEDLYGKTDKELFSTEAAEQFIKHDKEALAGSNGIQTVEIFEHADGRHFSLVTKFPIHTGLGGMPLVGGIGIDITDRIRFEQELKTSQERLQILTDKLEQLVDERTHELVQSRDQLRCLATELNLAEQRERKRLATELHDHLQQTLVLGRLKMGQGKRCAVEMPAMAKILEETDAVFCEALKYTRTLVAELSPPVLRDHGLAAGLKWLAEYMKKHEMSVAVTVPDTDNARLPDDQAVLLFQSVRELLINSSKHAGTGTATVLMEQEHGRIRIVVRDEGKGFDLAGAAGGHSGTSAPKFGLFSIRERMRALGGSFEIQSAPGKGTMAVLSLPLAVSIERGDNMSTPPSWLVSRISHANDASRETFHGHRIHVLLVDDHVMIRQGLRAVLDNYPDIEVVGEAANGEEAIRLVDTLRPAAVIMDINMPTMDGIEATEQITRRYSETIVIGLSVNAAEENEKAMKLAGAVGLMKKESAVEQLYSAIVEAVKKG